MSLKNYIKQLDDEIILTILLTVVDKFPIIRDELIKLFNDPEFNKIIKNKNG